jgi:uncharacterized protein YwgA
MDWRKDEIIISVIRNLKENGSLCCKTHIIKTLYLLKATKRIDMPFDFILYKHGPYSFDVEDSLALMKSYGAIEEDDTKSGIYGESLKLGDNADFPKKFVQLKNSELDAISEICKITGNKGVKELERLATSAWIVDDEKISNPEKIASRVHELKPHINKKQAKDAFLEIKPFLPMGN